jgi:hypothetical protein
MFQLSYCRLFFRRGANNLSEQKTYSRNWVTLSGSRCQKTYIIHLASSGESKSKNDVLKISR